MRRVIFASVIAVALAACGPSGGGRAGGPRSDNTETNAACALIADTASVFGAGAQVTGYPGIDDMAASCEFASADGARAGEIVLYTAQSLGSTTPQAKMDDIVQRWDAQTETALASIADLGEAAQIATDLPGYQTQIAFRKGGSLVLIAARSGEDSVTGEQLARRMATAAAGALH